MVDYTTAKPIFYNDCLKSSSRISQSSQKLCVCIKESKFRITIFKLEVNFFCSRSTKILLCRPIFSTFYNISQANIAVILVLRCFRIAKEEPCANCNIKLNINAQHNVCYIQYKNIKQRSNVSF